MYLKELDANLIVVLDALLIDASVTRAAERLGRSPSAVSHALSHLRLIFADDLFVRAGQRLVPTARASSLAPAVHVIVSAMESLLRPETPFDPVTQDRSFKLACSETREVTLLDGLRQRLAQVAPSIDLSWQAPKIPHMPRICGPGAFSSSFWKAGWPETRVISASRISATTPM